jgi:hypothetical protein
MTDEEQALIDEHFYRCPNTGDLVWKWADERMVLISSDDVRAYRSGHKNRVYLVPHLTDFDLDLTGRTDRVAPVRSFTIYADVNGEKYTLTGDGYKMQIEDWPEPPPGVGQAIPEDLS